MAVVNTVSNYLFHNTVGPVNDRVAPQSQLIPVIPIAATGAPSGHRAQGSWLRHVDAGDLDDGLPRGFLAGAIVEVWVALRLNWA